MKHKEPELNNFNPASGEKSFASPRSWEMVSDLMYVYKEAGKDIDRRDVAGLIGPGIAAKFKAFVDYGREAVPVDTIIKDPKGQSSSDRVKLQIPNDQVFANIVIKGKAGTVSAGGTSYVPAEVTPRTMLARRRER